MVKKLFIPLIVLHFTVIYLYGQNSDYNRELEKYVVSVIKNEPGNITTTIIKNADTEKVLHLCEKNISNTDANIRYKIIDLAKRKSEWVIDTTLKKKYAFFLIEAIKDNDGGNSGVASKGLANFKPTDFDQPAKDTLLALLKRKPYHYDQVVKLAGYINIEPAKIYLLQKLETDTILSDNQKWAIHLALARMGDESALSYCLNKVKSLTVNDMTVRFLFPDLVYIRKPESIKYLLEEIKNDTKNCNSPNPDSEAKIICAFKIMEMVAPVIEGFPVKVDKYGDLEIDNYDEALATVRKWIYENTDMRLKNDIY